MKPRDWIIIIVLALFTFGIYVVAIEGQSPQDTFTDIKHK